MAGSELRTRFDEIASSRSATTVAMPLPRAVELTRRLNTAQADAIARTYPAPAKDDNTPSLPVPISTVTVVNDGRTNPSDMTLGIGNTTPRLVGYQVAPFKKEWMAGVEVNMEMKSRFVVVEAKPEDRLGPNELKVDHILTGKIHLSSTENSAVIENRALAGLIDRKKTLPDFNTTIELGEINLAGAMGALSATTAGNRVNNEKPKTVNPAFHPVTVQTTASGQYGVKVESGDLELMHVITVPKEDFALVHRELDGKEIARASLQAGLVIYNPGSKQKDSGKTLVSIDLKETSFLNVNIKPAVALVNVMTQNKVDALVDKPGPFSNLKNTDMDTVMRVQALISLLAENKEPVQPVYGYMSENTSRYARTILGDDYSNDYKKNAEKLSEMIAGSDTAKQKITDLSSRLVEGRMRAHHTESFMLQAGLNALGRSDAPIDGKLTPAMNTQAKQVLAQAGQEIKPEQFARTDTPVTAAHPRPQSHLTLR